MPYELHYDDGTGETKKEKLDDIVKSKEFKSWSPKDKADFISFAHGKAKDPQTGEQPDYETFVKDTHRAIADAPRSFAERAGNKATELAGRAFMESAYTPEFRKKYDEAGQTVTEFAGEKAGEIGRKVAGGAVALGHGAMEMTTPADIVPAVGEIGRVTGATSKVSEALKAAKTADISELGKVDLGKAAGKAVEGAKGYFKEGVLPKSYFPPDMVPEGVARGVDEAGELAKTKVGAELPVAEKNLAKQAMEAKAEAPAPSRGSLPAGTEPKPILEPTPKPVQEAPAVKPAPKVLSPEEEEYIAQRKLELEDHYANRGGKHPFMDMAQRGGGLNKEKLYEFLGADSTKKLSEVEGFPEELKHLVRKEGGRSLGYYAGSAKEQGLLPGEADEYEFLNKLMEDHHIKSSLKNGVLPEAGPSIFPKGYRPKPAQFAEELVEPASDARTLEDVQKPATQAIDTEAAVKAEQARRPMSDAQENELSFKMLEKGDLSEDEWFKVWKSERTKLLLTSEDKAAVAKAGEAELRLKPKEIAPRELTPADVATKQRLTDEASQLIKGKLPEKPVGPKFNSLWERVKYKATKGLIDKNVGLVKMGFKDLHDMLLRGGSSNVEKFRKDTDAAVKALTDNISNPVEKELVNHIYKLRSVGEVYANSKGALDYGGIGSEAIAREAAIREGLIAEGKADVWARVDKAVEAFADATSSKSLERARSVIGAERADMLAQKYRYYTSFQSFDNEMAKFAHGDELAPTKEIPSLEDLATGWTKTREGGSFADHDILEQFQKSHWTKVVAEHKKAAVDMAVKTSHDLYGAKDLKKELELVGGKGWGVYKTADGMEHPMPDHVIQFLTSADPKEVSLFSEMSKIVNPVSRRGYLDLAAKYYPTMVLRDVYDILLRAPGYLTPQTKAIAQKLSKVTGITENAPDLVSIINPAPWLRGLKASWRVNFGYKSKTADAIFDTLAEQGALQSETIQHAMTSGKLKALYPDTASGVASKAAQWVWEGTGTILKFWDDAIRVGQSMRNMPQELRGAKNMGKILALEHLPAGPVSKEAMAQISRNVTIDFSMSGSLTKDMRALNPFINPALQDKFQTIQYAKNQPISFAMATAAMMTAAAASYIKWKGKPEGQFLNPRDTQRFVLADTGLRSKSGGAYAVPVMMIPDSLQGLWVAIRNAIDVVHQKDPEFRAIMKKNYGSKTASQVAGTVANVSGPLVAAVETMINHSFYLGRDIEGKYPETLSPEFRAQKNVPNVHRWLGKKTGISPDKSAYLTRGVLGTPGIKAAEAMDPLFAKGVSIPREGSEQMQGPANWIQNKIGGLPKAMGLVREQNYDSSYEDTQQFLEPTLAKETDTKEIIRQYGKRYGQEKDEDKKRVYLERAQEMYGQYLNSLTPDDRENVVKFPDIFGGAVKDAEISAATGKSKTLRTLLKQYPGVMRKIETNKEEEQAP